MMDSEINAQSFEQKAIKEFFNVGKRVVFEKTTKNQASYNNLLGLIMHDVMGLVSDNIVKRI